MEMSEPVSNRVIKQILELHRNLDVREGDFSFIIEDWGQKRIQYHWAAVQRLGLVDYFRNFGDGNFMFNTSPEMIRFGDAVDQEYGHSGASFACICRMMEYIAKTPWKQVVMDYYHKYDQILQELSPETLCIY